MSKTWLRFTVMFGTILAIDAKYAIQASAHGRTEIMSIGMHGSPANGNSFDPAISQDGRYVAFSSSASNLVIGDNNGVDDIFLRDLQTNTTRRVSIGLAGHEANGRSAGPSLSKDGRFISFTSAASNLVANDTNGWYDIFVFDQRLGITERISVSSSGQQSGGAFSTSPMSADGRFVAFSSDTGGLIDGYEPTAVKAYLRDRKLGTTKLVSISSTGTPASDNNFADAISSDGKLVVFESQACEIIIPPVACFGGYNVFVHDTSTGKTTLESTSLASAAAGSSSGGGISADGRFVAFWSLADNIVVNDTNRASDVFVRDRMSKQITRLSIGHISRQADGYSGGGAISTNGRFIAFWSYASNLVSGGTNGTVNAFVRDRRTSTTRQVSVSSAGIQGNGPSGDGIALSGDGYMVVFTSQADNLVSNDTNGKSDIFLRVLVP